MLSPLLVLGLISAPLPTVPEEPSTELNSKRRCPLSFLLLSLGDAESQVRTSALLDLISEVLEKHTDYAVELVTPEQVADCRGRLPCLVRRVRPDFDRSQLRTETKPSVGSRQVSESLLILSHIASGRKDRLIPQWIDTDAALDVVRTSAPDRDPSAVEAEVRSRALPVHLRSATVSSVAGARAWFRELVQRQLRPHLEAHGHWEPFGELWVRNAPDGGALILDGDTLGTTRAGTVRVRKLRPGPHQVELAIGTEIAWAYRFELGAKQRVETTVGDLPRDASAGSTALLWSGLALSAAGLVTTAVALAAVPQDVTVFCNTDCRDRPIGFNEALERTGPGGTPPDLLAAPLGIGMATTGATWSIGSLLERDRDVPWISILTGLALGGAVYGISAAMSLQPGRRRALKLEAPAAERNRQPIMEALESRLPDTGRILEIASGSGRHAVSFAERWTHLEIQPSEPTTEGRASIEAWRIETQLANLAPPLDLDVTRHPWPISTAGAIFCANMIHVAPWGATEELFKGAGKLLPHRGRLFTYGPYHIDGCPTSEGNAAFDVSLRRHNPAWGIRDIGDLGMLGYSNGLKLTERAEMPANNYLLVFERAP